MLSTRMYVDISLYRSQLLVRYLVLSRTTGISAGVLMSVFEESNKVRAIDKSSKGDAFMIKLPLIGC